jgi:hypothetical protein
VGDKLGNMRIKKQYFFNQREDKAEVLLDKMDENE